MYVLLIIATVLHQIRHHTIRNWKRCRLKIFLYSVIFFAGSRKVGVERSTMAIRLKENKM